MLYNRMPLWSKSICPIFEGFSPTHSRGISHADLRPKASRTIQFLDVTGFPMLVQGSIVLGVSIVLIDPR